MLLNKRSLSEKLRFDHIDLLEKFYKLEKENQELKDKMNRLSLNDTDIISNDQSGIEKTKESRIEQVNESILEEKNLIIDDLNKQLNKINKSMKTLQIENNMILQKFEASIKVYKSLVFQIFVN